MKAYRQRRRQPKRALAMRRSSQLSLLHHPWNIRALGPTSQRKIHTILSMSNHHPVPRMLMHHLPPLQTNLLGIV